MHRFDNIGRFGRRRFTTCLLAAGGLALAGCATGGAVKPPQVTLQNVRPLGGGLFAQQVAIDLRLTNPNDFDMPLDGMTADLTLNGQPFAQGVSDTTATIPRLGSETVTVTASVGTLDLARQIFNLGEARKLDYAVTGTAYLSRGLTRDSVDFDHKGSFDVTPQPDAPGHRLVPIGGTI